MKKASERTMKMAYDAMVAEVSIGNALLSIGPNTLGLGPSAAQTYEDFLFSYSEQTEEGMWNYIIASTNNIEQMAKSLRARM